jgi:hypothetical protein
MSESIGHQLWDRAHCPAKIRYHDLWM